MSSTARPPAFERCDRTVRITKSLLGYGVIAGPLYVLVVLMQALLRPGFDLSRDDVSLLSNGSLGWIQVVNFIGTGLMVVAFAVGVGRALPGRRSSWGGRLLGIYGLGLIAAGAFAADPMNGFPAGAPLGHPATVSVHGLLHIAAAGVGFLALVAACVVLANQLMRSGERRMAWFARITSVVFFVGFFAVASGSSSRVVVVGFWVALLLAWSWIAIFALHLYRRVQAADQERALVAAA